MSSLILLLPDWVQIGVMISYDSSDSHVCIVDPQYVDQDPDMSVRQVDELVIKNVSCFQRTNG